MPLRSPHSKGTRGTKPLQPCGKRSAESVVILLRPSKKRDLRTGGSRLFRPKILLVQRQLFQRADQGLRPPAFGAGLRFNENCPAKSVRHPLHPVRCCRRKCAGCPVLICAKHTQVNNREVDHGRKRGIGDLVSWRVTHHGEHRPEITQGYQPDATGGPGNTRLKSPHLFRLPFPRRE